MSRLISEKLLLRVRYMRHIYDLFKMKLNQMCIINFGVYYNNITYNKLTAFSYAMSNKLLLCLFNDKKKEEKTKHVRL